MKKLCVLAALAFVLAGSTVYSQACDFGMHAANSTPVVVACDGNGCTAAPTTQQPAANPEPAAPTVARHRPSARHSRSNDLTWVSWTKLCERMSLERS